MNSRKSNIFIVIFSRRRDSKAPWLDKYGPPMRTNYRVTIENLSTRVSWQVSIHYQMSRGRVWPLATEDNVLTSYYLQVPSRAEG